MKNAVAKPLTLRGMSAKVNQTLPGAVATSIVPPPSYVRKALEPCTRVSTGSSFFCAPVSSAGNERVKVPMLPQARSTPLSETLTARRSAGAAGFGAAGAAAAGALAAGRGAPASSRWIV